MKNKIIKYFILCVLIVNSFIASSQSKLFIATTRLNNHVIEYSKQISSEFEFIDFMKVNYEERSNLLEKCSGLMLLGGLDIHPARYKKNELANYCEIDEIRDSIEFSLLRWADTSLIPIFGICRGMQFINVYFGGTLCVDIPSFCNPTVKNEKHRDPKRKKDVYHNVIISENTKLSECFGAKKSIHVNSFHHQCVGELGKTLKISAKSPGGIIEGIENDNSQRKSFVLGVQWHPERYFIQDPDNLNIFREFFKEVKSRN